MRILYPSLELYYILDSPPWHLIHGPRSTHVSLARNALNIFTGTERVTQILDIFQPPQRIGIGVCISVVLR